MTANKTHETMTQAVLNEVLASPKKTDLRGVNLFQPVRNISGLDELQKSAIAHFMAVQNTKGKLIHVDEKGFKTEATDAAKKVRIFDARNNERHKTAALDIYQRGLQLSIAAITVAQYDPEMSLKIDIKTSQSILNQYINTASSIQQATDKDEVEQYEAMSILTHQLIGTWSTYLNELTDDAKSTPKRQHTNIMKAVDLNTMLNPTEDVICTLRTLEKNNETIYTLQLSEHSQVSNQAYKESHKWYAQNISKHGNWFAKFFAKHKQSLNTCSVPSSSRDLPFAPNAWHETTVHCTTNEDNNIERYHATHSGRIGITTPFDLKGKALKEERIECAKNAMVNTLKPELEGITARRKEKWGDWANTKGPIPILHQTLVAPVAYGGLLGMKDSAFITEKTASNKLAIEEINKDTPDEFELLETNNCINIHRHAGFRASRDRAHSQKLVAHAVKIIKNSQNDFSDNDVRDNIGKVLDFLNASNTFPPKFKNLSKKQRQAMDALCNTLLETDPKTNSLITTNRNRDLALLIQSCVELKRLNHESLFAKPRRRLNESVPLMRPITYVLFLPAQIGRYIANIPDKLLTGLLNGHPNKQAPLKDKVLFRLRPFAGTLLGGPNKQTHKSALETIIADSVGFATGGCKSALDRKGEEQNVKNSLLDHFHTNGSLPDFYNGNSYASFHAQYVMKNENAGHQKRVPAAADCIGERKMHETRNEAYINDTQEEKRKAKLGADFRKPKASKWEKYITKDSNPFQAIALNVNNDNPKKISEPLSELTVESEQKAWVVAQKPAGKTKTTNIISNAKKEENHQSAPRKTKP